MYFTSFWGALATPESDSGQARMTTTGKKLGQFLIMVKQILGELKEELETIAGSVIKQAGQAVGGIGSDAVGQVTGQPKGDKNAGDSQWEQIVGKPMDPKRYQKMQNSEEAEKQKNMAAIRRNLQQALELSPQKQEPPKYIKAKVEKQKEMQKLQEDEKKKPKDWAVKAAKGMASGETHGGWGVGG